MLLVLEGFGSRESRLSGGAPPLEMFAVTADTSTQGRGCPLLALCPCLPTCGSSVSCQCQVGCQMDVSSDSYEMFHPSCARAAQPLTSTAQRSEGPLMALPRAPCLSRTSRIHQCQRMLHLSVSPTSVPWFPGAFPFAFAAVPWYDCMSMDVTFAVFSCANVTCKPKACPLGYRDAEQPSSAGDN